MSGLPTGPEKRAFHFPFASARSAGAIFFEKYGPRRVTFRRRPPFEDARLFFVNIKFIWKMKPLCRLCLLIALLAPALSFGLTVTVAPAAMLVNPGMDMSGGPLKLGSSWWPVAGQYRFAILTFANQSGLPASGTIDCYFDGNQTLAAADIVARADWATLAYFGPSTDPNYSLVARFNYSNFAPGQQRHLYFKTTTNAVSPETTIRNLAVATGLNGKGLLTKKEFSMDAKLFAHDPNGKAVKPEKICAWSGEASLKYTVHFQNDGDGPTASIHVEDELDPGLVAPSALLAASSHACTLITAGQLLDFDFGALALPGLNQHSPFQYTYDETIGAFEFTVNTLPNLAPGVLPNVAEIFFDGSGLKTDPAELEIVECGEDDTRHDGGGFGDDGNHDEGGDDNPIDGRSSSLAALSGGAISAAPNPFADRLEVRLPSHFSGQSPMVEVFNLQGKLMAVQQPADGSPVFFETSAWPTGGYFARFRTAGETGMARIIKH